MTSKRKMNNIDYKTMMEIETEEKRYEIEEIILGMADLVLENRKLRYELEIAKEYEKKYNELFSKHLKSTIDGANSLIKAIVYGSDK